MEKNKKDKPKIIRPGCFEGVLTRKKAVCVVEGCLLMEECIWRRKNKRVSLPERVVGKMEGGVPSRRW